MVEYGFAVYKKEDALYAALDKEREQLNQKLNLQKSNTTQSTLYAARLAEIYDFVMVAGSNVNQPMDEKAKEANLFVKDKLDMEVLYTSGYWSSLIEGWMQLQQNIIKDDKILLADTKQILSRIKDNAVYTAFVEKMVFLYTKNGKDDLVSSLTDYVAKSGRLQKPGKKLTAVLNGPTIGASAPALQMTNGKKGFTKKTVLFFYESGCNNCENEIHQLLGNYKIVQDKGYDVISVAADMTQDAGDGHNHAFPWKDQFCDFKGFAGPNFVTFGIVGTPTFFIIDAKGKITGRYARLIDSGILN